METDAAPCASMGGARRRPLQNSQRVLLAMARWCAAMGGARGERGKGCEATHRGGEPPRAMWRGGASQEGGEPPRAVAAKHRALPPCRTGAHTATGHGRCVRRWGCHRVRGARGKALFREMVESLFREEFPAGFTIAVGNPSALKVFADHSDRGAKDIRKGLQKIG